MGRCLDPSCDQSEKRSERGGWSEQRSEVQAKPKLEIHRTSDYIIKQDKQKSTKPKFKNKKVAGIRFRNAQAAEDTASEWGMGSDYAGQRSKSHNSSQNLMDLREVVALTTTRSVYEKKLKQLLDQGPPVPQAKQNGNGDMEQYSDSEEEDLRERRAQQGRDASIADVSNSSIFNHSKTPFILPSEASKSNTAFESSFSVSRMVEQMDQRPSMCHVGGHQKTTGSGIRSSYSAKDALMVDKNTMTYRTPTNTPKACVFARQNRFQADDLLQKDELADRYVPSTEHPLGLSATRRKPIKGAAGRPIQFKYDDIMTQAKLVEQTKAQTEKVPPRKGVPLYVHVALFAFVAFLALVFLTMEHNPENPFHAHVEKVDAHQPQ